LALVLAQLCGASPTAAATPDCTGGYVKGQQSRKQGRLKDARARFMECANPACAAYIREDCTAWLAEVEGAMPTLVVEVAGPDGTDVVDARVFVDGVLFANKLEGLARAIDPGTHVVRVDLQRGPSLEQNVLIKEGAKARLIRFVVPPARPAGTPAPRAPATPHEETRPVPLASWVLGGLAVAALGMGIGLLVDDVGRAHSYNAECPQSGGTAAECPSDRASNIHRQASIAYAAMGASVLLAGAAGALYLFRPARAAKVGPAAMWINQGLGAALAGSF
jgi:hypothetical protein